MSGYFNAAGTRITKAAFPATAASDPLMRVTADVYDTREYGDSDPKVEGTIRRLAIKSGAEMRQSQIDAMFPAATADSVTPATGPTAGGTVVTVRGANLDGVTQVQFGATPGTALAVVSSRELRVTAPAGTAGAKNVVITDDSGTVTKTGAYTYA